MENTSLGMSFGSFTSWKPAIPVLNLRPLSHGLQLPDIGFAFLRLLFQVAAVSGSRGMPRCKPGSAIAPAWLSGASSPPFTGERHDDYLCNYNTDKKTRMDGHIAIREYRTTDKESLLELIRLNTPRYFAAEEELSFGKYLDEEVELYYVLLVDGKIAGCGGINFADGKTTGKISWDIIHPDYQGKSLGKRLLRFRIDKLGSISGIRKITVRTSQLVYKFYEKQGFVLLETQKDYWAQGLDLYKMEYGAK